jgi:hypothetical protein
MLLNLELECRLVNQRMEDLRSRADRRRLLRAARTTPRVERRGAEVVRIPRAPDLRKGRA